MDLEVKKTFLEIKIQENEAVEQLTEKFRKSGAFVDGMVRLLQRRMRLLSHDREGKLGTISEKQQLRACFKGTSYNSQGVPEKSTEKVHHQNT